MPDHSRDPRVHSIKVQPPYFDALVDGSKTFEVRPNDRSYQAGDVLVLNEWHPAGFDKENCHTCRNFSWEPHYTTGRVIRRRVTFVYSGDPRFGGLEPGHVVLALGAAGVGEQPGPWAEAPRPERPIPESHLRALEEGAEPYEPQVHRSPPRRPRPNPATREQQGKGQTDHG